jgi:hypothetical protein
LRNIPEHRYHFAGECPRIDDGRVEITDKLRVQSFERAAEGEKGALRLPFVNLHLKRADSVLLEFDLNVLECPGPDRGACSSKENRIGDRLVERPLLLLDQLDRLPPRLATSKPLDKMSRYR